MTAKYDIARPYTASYVFLRRGDKIAFLLRTNTDYMRGYWGSVGGKVEKDETYTEAAVREAKEEAGVTVAPENLKHVLTSHRLEGTLWVDVFFMVTEWEGEPVNAEPDTHGELKWLDIHDLPDNVAPVLTNALDAIEAGKTYVEFWHPELTEEDVSGKPDEAVAS
jgi:ADP-ribose pyrophosphatase YjhB (NUDIX family)